jgi:hypothetical protein
MNRRKFVASGTSALFLPTVLSGREAPAQILGIGHTSVNSWSVWTQTQYMSQNLTLVDGSPSPQPTIPTLKWRNYAFKGDWKLFTTAGDLLATLHNVNLLFKYDPSYPNLNPSVAIFTCTITTANRNGHFWQTDQYPQPVFALSIMGKSGYDILPLKYLGDVKCMPSDTPFSFTFSFDPTQWDAINYAQIFVGRMPQAIWRRHDQG